jgi:hypothetical protein
VVNGWPFFQHKQSPPTKEKTMWRTGLLSVVVLLVCAWVCRAEEAYFVKVEGKRIYFNGPATSQLPAGGATVAKLLDGNDSISLKGVVVRDLAGNSVSPQYLNDTLLPNTRVYVRVENGRIVEIRPLGKS